MDLPLIGPLKLRGRLTFLVTLLSVGPLLAFAWLETTRAQRLMEEQIEAALHVEAEGLKDLVEATLAEREANVRSWAEEAIVRGALLFDTYEKSDAVLTVLQRRYPTFTGIVLFTPEGTAVSASAPALREAYAGREAEVRGAPWFRAAVQGRLTSEGLTRTDPILKVQVLPFAVPVLHPTDGQLLGVLLGAYDWGRLAGVVEPALARAHARSLRSFTLQVRQQDGAVLFESRGQGTRDAGLLSSEAINLADVRDVGDGWRFVAQVSAEEAYAPARKARRHALLMALGLVVLAAGASLLLAHRLAAPITTLSTVVGRILKEGDLTQRLEVKSRDDEVGELAGAFTRLLENLRETVASLQRGTAVLSDTVRELTRAAEEQERTVSRQAQALQETQQTAQELRQTSLIAAERAGAVLKVASRAEQVGRSGEAAIEQSLGGFELLREQVLQMTGRISGLEERARQIGTITQAVKGLADQSNMLALNAAIEAVRSGEHGKGFGVVAREIRGLADQSIQSTERAREILEDLSGAILATAQLGAQGHARMEEGLAQVRASGQSLRELIAIVQGNASSVGQIAGAVSQQDAGIAQLSGAVTDLSALMDATVAGLQATTRATGALREVAAQMQDVARSYRV